MSLAQMSTPNDASAAEDRPRGGPDQLFDFDALVPFTCFADVLGAEVFTPVPDSWFIGHCDIVDSTGAIRAGRYRTVNFAGAAPIAAVRNALKGRSLAFVFGGDGASLILSPSDRPTVEAALAATVTFVREEFELTLRAALIPISLVREAGLDLRVARFAASDSVAYAMFEGGGLAFADARTKAGLDAVAPAPPGSRPDLTGLSCRFEPVPASMGLILSILAVPNASADRRAIRAVFTDLLGVIDASPGMGRPLPVQGPPLAWPSSGSGIETSLRGKRFGSRALRRVEILGRSLVVQALFRLGLSVGGFSPKRYLRELEANSDFRKFDDGLRMTVACDAATADAIEAHLKAAREAGLLRYGLHRQDAAVVTCITPSATASDHVHFVDGADGGYAMAALQLKTDAP